MNASEFCDTYFALQNVWVKAMVPETQQRSPAKTPMSRGRRIRNGAIRIQDWIMVSIKDKVLFSNYRFDDALLLAVVKV